MDKVILKDIEILENFGRLDKDILIEICDKSYKTNFHRGHQLFMERDVVNNIYIVLSGKVSLYKISEEGQKRVIFILGEGSIINDVIIDNGSSSVNCEIFEDSVIMIINKDELLKLMEKYFSLTKVIIESMTKKIRRTYRQLKNTVPLKIEKKLAAKLWKLSKDYGIDGEKGTVIDMTMTVTYLANMFGCSRETMSRAIKVLEDKNLIAIKNKKITVINRENLAKYFKGM
ncbi:bacterial regulatory s, crp family protein [Clostridium argentinense CDC 2741]|uniref:Bacterial regulatory s, crp family protein n=1 Tax=Clostridium argentinense CDC 2741 TaxID=1418104 RepID=A0A0C1R471_9CLOT|nr:Crp/Fnr family transcriptional regulator [Clostridium argentinense]ARC84953.1 Crp/Fnr family transcriptional regulator [Clostridium argentinense]KIE48327.1 bacterial regulatory s, crp family protein [Clostridium argentinense CDC 2741]NFF41572.1 Crp/Fnr family transcriptional regulator [Clostridium argentinense]NFP52515.1 Crp/Fnr family transcriptional regulator [Clostridium argentinense]NFP74855.1 Crp/Fnr family transcriptional regulator [Clostridium argentinense]